MTEPKRRFASPTVLTDATPFMGATAGEWREALTGHGQFQKQLDVLKARVLELEGQPPIELPTTAQDVGSSYKKMMLESANHDAPNADGQA